MKKIVLTGGGTAGHVTPNIALIESLKDLGFEIHYIGQKASIEERLIRELPENKSVEFHRISAGKLRRDKSLKSLAKNATDAFKVLAGFAEARAALANIKPDVIFSKGGFVAVPVVLSAKTLGIPVVVHESDLTPGLTNRISLPLAENVCVSFSETAEYIKKRYKKDCVVTGSPVRPEVLNGDRNKGRKFCNFANDNKPVVLVICGSQGSRTINDIVRKAIFNKKLEDYNVIQVTGPKNMEVLHASNLLQFEYLNDELADILEYADVVVSRAGANTIFELLALKKPHILIPLPKGVSRGDQIDNANQFVKEGYSAVLDEDELDQDSLVNMINYVNKNRQQYIDEMKKSNIGNSIERIIGVINASYKG